MGHRPDPARPALARALCIALALLAACAPRPASGPGDAPGILVVAVSGLSVTDPLIDAVEHATAPAEAVVASGTGASALLALLDGRPALDQLREARDPLAWATALGWTTRIDVLDPTLRSQPEWVHSGATFHFVDAVAREATADLHVVVVPRGAITDVEFVELLGDRREHPVVVTGIPLRPDDTEGAEEVLARLRVPVLSNGLGPDVGGARTLGDVLAPLRGEVRRRGARSAWWWDHRGGGVAIEHAAGWVVGGSGRTPVVVGDAAGVDAAAVVDDALPAGSLLVLLRGSEDADLTSLEILTSTEAEWRPWGLEAIDTVQHPTARYLQLDLAVEPEGDGILIARAQHQTVDIRLLAPMEDAPWIGAPVRDAASGRWLDFDGIRISPWSRDFLRLSRTTAFDTESWWPATTAGIDLLWVPDGADPPAAIVYPEVD